MPERGKRKLPNAPPVMHSLDYGTVRQEEKKREKKKKKKKKKRKRKREKKRKRKRNP